MSDDETIIRKADDAIRELAELFSNPKTRSHLYRRYVLIRHTSEELLFEQEEFDFHFDQVIAETFGQRKPRRRRITIKS